MRATKGLIIADPWIGYILGGTKDWEMRSSSSSHRGWFGLIRKGTGAVHGVARLIDVGGPLSVGQMITSVERHRIPERMIRSGEVAKWNIPWKLADIRQLMRPVPYRHKNGAVTWVELDDAAIEGIASQLAAGVTATNPVPPMRSRGVAGYDGIGRTDTAQVDVSRRGRKLYPDGDWGDGIPNSAARAACSSLAVIDAAPPTPAVIATTFGTAARRMIGEVAITEGNIANNHIYLRSLFDLFPADAVGGSNKTMRAKRDLTIDWGGPEPVETDLDGQKKFFRARGWIAAFYQLHGARAGDFVMIEETAPYCYRVDLRRHGSQGRAA
ncbi:hypothetical protein [Bradyrhizobium sp. USDA 3256]